MHTNSITQLMERFSLYDGACEMTPVIVYKNGEKATINVVKHIWKQYYAMADSIFPESQQIMLKMDGKIYNGAHEYILEMLYFPELIIDDIATGRMLSNVDDVDVFKLCVTSWLHQYIIPDKLTGAMKTYMKNTEAAVMRSHYMFDIMTRVPLREWPKCYDQYTIARNPRFVLFEMIPAELKLRLTEGDDATVTIMRIVLIYYKPKMLAIRKIGLESAGEITRILEANNIFPGSLYLDVITNGIRAINADIAH